MGSTAVGIGWGRNRPQRCGDAEISARTPRLRVSAGDSTSCRKRRCSRRVRSRRRQPCKWVGDEPPAEPLRDPTATPPTSASLRLRGRLHLMQETALFPPHAGTPPTAVHMGWRRISRRDAETPRDPTATPPTSASLRLPRKPPVGRPGRFHWPDQPSALGSTAGIRGNRTRTRVYPSWPAMNSMEPWCDSTIHFAMLSPRPEPSASGLHS